MNSKEDRDVKKKSSVRNVTIMLNANSIAKNKQKNKKISPLKLKKLKSLDIIVFGNDKTWN